MKEIQIMNAATLGKMIEAREPRGLFLAEDGGVWVAVDNGTGDAWVEEFKSKEDAADWLRGAGE